MQKEKRMAENYEITHGLKIGDSEVVFGMDETCRMPYFCAFCKDNGISQSYSECMVGDDYVELLELFADRVKSQCRKVRKEQEGMGTETITADMCLPLTDSTSLIGKAAAVRADILRPEYRRAEYQIMLVTGGNGAKENGRGRACFCTELHNRRRSRWDRQDFIGEVKEECLPQWAKERLAEIKAEESGRDA